MKKRVSKILAGAMQFLLLGAAAPASSAHISSRMNSSRSRSRNVFIQNVERDHEKKSEETKKSFSAFSSQEQVAEERQSSVETDAVLNFLTENNLLSSTEEKSSTLSGDVEGRKRFAVGPCTYMGNDTQSVGGYFPNNYTNQVSCESYGFTWNGGGGDVTAPTVTGSAVTGGPSATDTTLTFRMTFDESVENMDTSDFELTATGTATGTIASVSSATGSQVDVTVNSVSGVGTLRLDLAAGHNVQDAAANAIAGGYTAGTAHTVEILPAITSATYNASTGSLVVTGTNFYANAGASNDIDASKLTVTGENGDTYTLTDTADVERDSVTQFTLTLSATDLAAINAMVNKDGTSSTGSTTYNLAAADDFVASTTTGDSADATNAITVSNVSAPTISSATYASDTNTLVVTGTGFFYLTGGTNDIDVTKLTFTGEGGSTHTLTAGQTNNVEIDSATQFTVTLGGTDVAAVEALLNINGTSSDDSTTYNLAGAEDWNAGADGGLTIADATNAITVSGWPEPSITSATYDASTGSLVVTGTDFTAKSGATNDIDASKFTLTGENGDTYTLTDTSDVEITNSTSFTLTLSATDLAAINAMINKDGTSSTGSTTYNLAAADDFVAEVTTGDTADTTNAITVSNVTAPAITSATYDTSTGALVVTGTNIPYLTGGTNDIDASKFTLTGEDGDTYTLVGSSDVEITSATSFTITLDATDKAAVNLFLNANGTSSTGGTTYNLAAAEDWAAGADSGVNVADTTGNGITVSNVTVPTITSATYASDTNTLVVTGTGLFYLTGGTNDIDVTKLTFTGEGGATHTLTSGQTTNVEIDSATQFTVTLGGTDVAAVEALLNINGTSSDDSTTYNLAGAEDWNAGAGAALTIADATNAITVSGWPEPTLTSATYDASTGSLVVTGTDFSAKSGASNDIDASKFTLTGENGDTYTLTDTSDVEITNSTSFTLTLSATDQAAVNAMFNKDGASSTGGTTYNLAGADDFVAETTTGDTTDATNAVTVSNVSAPAITSATYDASTGALVVTGTKIPYLTGGTNDIDASKFTLTGEDGDTYTLVGSSDVEITSATSFTITLDATDKAAVNLFLNADGTSSTGGTTYNLAAAEDWATGADSGVNIADTTSNGITVSNVSVPTITSATYASDTNTLVVTATGLFYLTGGTNDIDVSKLTFTGEGGATHTLTAGQTTDVEIDSATQFTVTIGGTDVDAVETLLNVNGTSSDDSTTYNLAGAEDWNAGAGASLTIADGTNAITVSGWPEPSITSATYDASTGSLVVTGNDFSAKSGATNDIDASKFTFTGEDGSTYTLTDTSDVEITNSTSFTLTLSATDLAAVNAIINKDGTSSTGGTTYNLAVADDFVAESTIGDTSDTTGNGITVSNVPAPAITSATYDASSGTLVVTGSDIPNLTGGSNDIDASKFTLTGEDGTTYTLVGTSDIERTSATSFTITLDATDKAAVNLFLNANGTSSTGGTTYNLAAAEDWAAGADSGVNVADTTGNGVTVSNVAIPTLISATYSSNTGVVAVTAANLFFISGATNDIDLTTLTLTGEGGGTHTLAATDNVDITDSSNFSFTLAAADKNAVDLILHLNGTSSDDGTTYNLAASEDWNLGAESSVVIADATNAITVSGWTVPAISSATYDVSTGNLLVTGTDLEANAGSSNDIDVSLITLTGEGGQSYTLTSDDVEIDDATQFSVILNSADKSAVDNLFNKNGTSSDDATTYNLALADDYMTSLPQGDISDTTNSVTVSKVAPVVSSPSANVEVNAATQTVSGTHTTDGATIRIFEDTDNDGVADNNTDQGSDVVASGTWSIDVNLSADTTHNFVAVADPGGVDESSPVDVFTIVEDSTAPVDPTVTTPSTALSVSTTPQTISGTHTEDGVLIELFADADNNGVADDATVLDSDTVVSGNWSLSATLTTNQANDFVVRATDSVNNASSNIDVPTITHSDIPVIAEGSSLSVSLLEDNVLTLSSANISVSDPDNDALSWTVSANGSHGNVTSLVTSGNDLSSVVYTPNSDYYGSDNFVLQVEDDVASVNILVELTIEAVNDAPSITSSAITAASAANLYNYVVSVEDVDDANDGSELSWSLTTAPTGMSIDSTGNISWTPQKGVSEKSEAVIISVSDGGEDGSVAATQSFTISVSGLNEDPIISNLDQDALVYREDDGQMLIDASSDASVSDDSPDFNGGVLSVNIISGGNSDEDLLSIYEESDSISLTGNVVTYNGNTLGYSHWDSEAGEFLISLTDLANPSTVIELLQVLSYENSNLVDPSEDSRTLSISLSDGDGGTSQSHEITISVQQNNDAPIAATQQFSIAENSDLGVSVGVLEATDEEGVAITYTLSDSSVPFVLDSETGALEVAGALDHETISSYSLNVKAEDDLQSTNFTVTVEVSDVNESPVFSDIQEQELTPNVDFLFTQSVSDPENDDLSLIVLGDKPDWLSVSLSNSAIVMSGTPGGEDALQSYALDLVISDAEFEVEQSLNLKVIADPNATDETDVVEIAMTTMSFTVLDENGDAIEGAKVSILGSQNKQFSNADGQAFFDLSNVSDVDYRVAAKSIGYLRSIVEVEAGTLSTNITLTRATYTLQGQVFSDEDNQLGAVVVANHATLGTYDTDVNSDGTYSIGLPAPTEATDWTLAASLMGYAANEQSLTIAPRSSQTLDFTLVPETILSWKSLEKNDGSVRVIINAMPAFADGDEATATVEDLDVSGAIVSSISYDENKNALYFDVEPLSGDTSLKLLFRGTPSVGEEASVEMEITLIETTEDDEGVHLFQQVNHVLGVSVDLSDIGDESDDDFSGIEIPAFGVSANVSGIRMERTEDQQMQQAIEGFMQTDHPIYVIDVYTTNSEGELVLLDNDHVEEIYLTFSYDPTIWNPQVDSIVYSEDNGVTWFEFPRSDIVSVDSVRNTVTILTDHLSQWTLTTRSSAGIFGDSGAGGGSSGGGCLLKN